MTLTRRSLLAAGSAAAMSSLAGVAHAQGDFPQRPVKIVVPYAAGGGTDVIARLVAKAMTAQLGQTVLVDNKPGGGTVIGAQEVARAAPDGYTLLWSDNATYALNPYLYKKLPYSPLDSFTPISKTLAGSLVLAVHPSLGIQSLKELLAYAKANPGKLNYASAGQGTPHHLAMEALKFRTGSFMVHMPYRGEGPAVQDLLGGSVQLLFMGALAGKSHADAGRIRLLATAGTTRNPSLPDLPTVAEAGVPGYESSFWQALVAPAGTPEPVVRRLRDAYAKATQDAEVTGFIAKFAPGTRMDVSTGPELRAHMQREMTSAQELIKAIGLTLD